MSRAGTLGTKVRHGLIGLSGAAIGIFLWWAIVEVFNIQEYIVPAPQEVARAFEEDFSTLMSNLWPTAYESLMGFALGNTIGILVAIAFVHSKVIERSFFPVAVFVQTLPLVAIAPVLVLMFGPGATSKIVIAALITLFPTLVNMVRGLNSVSPQTFELFRVMSASRWDTFWKARTFASLPFLFSSLKIASTTAVIGAIVAEWVGADKGLGYLIINATYNFQTPLLYAAMIVASLFALTLFLITSLVERRVVTWDVGD